MAGRGIMYVATGSRHMHEAVRAARSAQTHLPNLPRAIYTDAGRRDEAVKSGLFDRVEIIDNPEYSYLDKIEAVSRMPFEQTLFLDTDTVVVDPCEEIFAPLEVYDLAAAHEYYRGEFIYEDLPRSHPTMNTGVIAFRRSDAFRRFAGLWRERFVEERQFITAQEKPSHHDQPAFRFAVFHSKLRMFVLANEYNFRPYYPNLVAGACRIKIIHDHHSYLEGVAKLLNNPPRGAHPRLYGPIHPFLIAHWYWWKARNVVRRT